MQFGPSQRSCLIFNSHLPKESWYQWFHFLINRFIPKTHAAMDSSTFPAHFTNTSSIIFAQFHGQVHRCQPNPTSRILSAQGHWGQRLIVIQWLSCITTPQGVWEREELCNCKFWCACKLQKQKISSLVTMWRKMVLLRSFTKVFTSVSFLCTLHMLPIHSMLRLL